MGAALISGMWSGITFFCDRHQEKLEIRSVGSKVVYACPHCDCNNKIDLYNAEKAIQKITGIIGEYKLASAVMNMTNYKWSSKGYKFKVKKHNPFNDHLVIEVENTFK